MREGGEGGGKEGGRETWRLNHVLWFIVHLLQAPCAVIDG